MRVLRLTGPGMALILTTDQVYVQYNNQIALCAKSKATKSHRATKRDPETVVMPAADPPSVGPKQCHCGAIIDGSLREFETLFHQFLCSRVPFIPCF